MRRRVMTLGLLSWAALSFQSPVQAAPPTYQDSAGQTREAEGFFCPDLTKCGGSSGGGGGAVTAASGAYALGSIVDLGTGASPGANTVNGRLSTIATNTTGIATSANQSTLNTAVGTPTDAPATTTDTTSTSLIAQIKQLTAAVKTLSATVATSGAAYPGTGVSIYGNDITSGNNLSRPIMTGITGALVIGSSATSSTALVSGNNASSLSAASMGSGLTVRSPGYYFDNASSVFRYVLGDTTGAFVHAPTSTVVTGGGTITTSGTTVALTFTNTTDGEVMNPSTGTLWASWGTPAVNGANSFPINAGGSYRPPSRVAGTLTLLSTAASQTYTFNKF